MHRNFMAIVPHFLHHLIVGELMWYIECSFDRATIRIFAIGCEQFLCEEFPIFKIDGIIERQYNHLRHLIRFQTSRYQCAIFRTKAVR